MALSIASTGLSLGGVILTPLSVMLVESVGFETAAPLMGAMYVIGVVSVAWIWLRPSPASMGLSVDGVSDPMVKDPAGGDLVAASNTESTDFQETQEVVDGLSFRQARQGRFFWGVSLAYIFLMMAQVGGIVD